MLTKLDNFIYRYKYNFAKHLPLRAPVDVSLELSSACNQQCVYCYHADGKNLPFKRGFMNENIARTVIDQCHELEVPSIKFNYRGESTLHPYFESLTSRAKRLSTKKAMIDRLSNSNFKFKTDRDDIFRGLSNQTKVKVSFDSFIKGVMETQRAGSDHDLTLKNIDKFYNFPDRISSETVIVIQAVRTNLNKDEDIAGEVKRRWPEALVSIRDMVTGRVEKDISNLENRKRDASQRISCIQAHARLIIRNDGDVGMCCPDIGGNISLGNAQETSLYYLWNSDKAKQIRESLKNKSAFEKDPCKNCSSYESFKGYKQPWGS